VVRALNPAGLHTRVGGEEGDYIHEGVMTSVFRSSSPPVECGPQSEPRQAMRGGLRWCPHESTIQIDARSHGDKGTNPDACMVVSKCI